jgi:hypothetical protein
VPKIYGHAEAIRVLLFTLLPCEIPSITVDSANVAAYDSDPYHHGVVNGAPNPSFA